MHADNNTPTIRYHIYGTAGNCNYHTNTVEEATALFFEKVKTSKCARVYLDKETYEYHKVNVSVKIARLTQAKNLMRSETNAHIKKINAGAKE